MQDHATQIDRKICGPRSIANVSLLPALNPKHKTVSCFVHSRAFAGSFMFLPFASYVVPREGSLLLNLEPFMTVTLKTPSILISKCFI